MKLLIMQQRTFPLIIKKKNHREVGEGNEKELEFVKSELKSLVVESKEKESCSSGE